MSIEARIRNIDTARARQKIAALREPPWSRERKQTADALDAVMDLIAPFSAPRLDDSDALLADGLASGQAAVNLATAAAAWSEVE